ncbi:hypothetical protein, partial [Klebsiella pneumoniae]|uniref:hypothetical protein n=1 Tax=Klebsiella pneumoniae TaxID=573 RepID=UPI003967F83A
PPEGGKSGQACPDEQPKAFGTSLAMTGSPVGAMKVFFVFYVVCVLVTWLVYGRRKPA